MSKYIKSLITDDLRDAYEGVESACVVDLTGVDVQQTELLRAKLREKSARIRVVRNSLARRAFEGGPLAPLADSFEGPTALVTSEDSIIDVAKLLTSLDKDIPNLKLRGGIFEGEPEILSVVMLSKMRSKAELLGDVAMLIGSPSRSIAGCIGGAQARIAGCLKAIADKE